ncbi:glutamate--tRNA ligase [Candidatus Gracilibacteria bacterium]|nr:glutamate--tRNA ligase [Candidatus Gracilibacteria bacterium]NUJ99407.1 glutamate--tRNA ligase [Candidatus Gracilibacteria bacterium]
MTQKIITRFAPSPTGYVHIGSLRTVLYNYLFAKKNDGKFMLRVEDTDQSRYVEGSIENMLFVLASVGLIPDEGPNNPGEKGPYFQSQRLEIYQKYIAELIKNDKAYYCFCSSERLDELRNEQQELNLPTKYDQRCRYLTKEEIAQKLEAKLPYTIRLKVPKNEVIVFDDMIRGKIEIHTKDIDDQVLMKSDGFPTYHFANVVDDYLMEVTHVIRGEEWVPSTPKHILIYNAFGWTPPLFAHLPLLLGKDKKKLSKRTGDVSVESYLEKGYIVEALINYIALLGWNPKTTEEFFTIDELITRFDIVNVHKAGAVFDTERLDWFSGKYIASMDNEELFSKLLKYLNKYDESFYEKITQNEEYAKKILTELKGRMRRFDEFKEFSKFFYEEPNVRQDLLINEKMKIENFDIVKKGLQLARDILGAKDKKLTSPEEIKNTFIEAIQESGMKNGQVLWPLRVALSGEEFSPGALELIYLLGKEKSIQRIEKILNTLQ